MFMLAIKTRPSLLYQLLLIFATSNNYGHNLMGIVSGCHKDIIQTIIYAIHGCSHIFWNSLQARQFKLYGSYPILDLSKVILWISHFSHILVYYIWLGIFVSILVNILVSSLHVCDIFFYEATIPSGIYGNIHCSTWQLVTVPFS